MGNKCKILGAIPVFLTIISAILVPSAACQTTNYYSNNAEINSIAFTLTISNPQDQATYSKSIPLQVNLIWNESLESLLASHMPVKGYAYKLDNNPLVNLTPNGSLAIPRKENYWFAYSIDISNLSQGRHEFSVIVYQYYNGSDYQGLFNKTSSPIGFTVDNTLPTITPTPTVPEVPWLATVALIVSGLLATLVVKQRKTTNQTQ
jgi:hypothetical protein